MRDALLRSAAFCAGLFLVAALLHLTLLGGLRRLQNGAYGVRNRIVDGRVRAEVLVSGSSRSFVGIDAARLGELTGLASHNISADGSRLEAQLALLATYLEHNPAPRLLLQSLDAFSLEPLEKVYQPELYLPHLGEPAIYSYVTSVDRSFRAMRYLPLHGFAVNKRALFDALYGLSGRERKLRDPFSNGSLLRDRGWDGSFERYLATHPEGETYRATAAGLSNLAAIVELARRRHVPLVFVYPPEHELSEKIVRNRREMIALLADLARRHEVPFWDYSAHPICGEKDCFYNTEHLNVRGAHRFTDELAARVTAYLASR